MQRIVTKTILLGIICAILSLNHPAFADGVTDIKPTGSATFTISQPGTYVLVSNVSMTANAPAITISVSDVSLDLNGHTISGNGFATSAIGISGSASERTSIVNGTVRNFGSHGIELGAGARVQDVKVIANGGSGLKLGTDAIVERVHATGNCTAVAGGGIQVGNACVIDRCIAKNNGPPSAANAGVSGISAGSSCSITNNICEVNVASGTGQAAGIYTALRARIVDNVCANNAESSSGNGTGYGIYANSYSIITGNSCTSNGSGLTSDASGGSGWGIRADTSCTIEGNHCEINRGSGTGTARGIEVAGSATRIVGNLSANNFCGASGQSHGIYLNASGVFVADNVVSGNTTSAIHAVAISCRIERNRLSGNGSGPSQITGNAFDLGTGDLENRTY